jgi:hypothetical protein
MPPPLAFQGAGLGTSPEVFYQWWQQFQLCGFDNGSCDGVFPSIGIAYNLTSANLLALNSTAVQLVAPPLTGQLGTLLTPPNGFAFYPMSLSAEFIPGGTPYTIASGDNAFQIEYTGKTTSLISLTVTGLVDQTVVTWAQNMQAATGTKFSKANSANLGMEVKLAGTTPALTLGNGTANLYLNYTIIPLQ